MEPSKEPNEVPLGLILAPSVCRERANIEQVRTSPAQQSESGHRSARASGAEVAENAFEARVLCDSTLLAFDQCGADGFDFVRPLDTNVAIEAFDEFMRDTRALISF